MQWVSGATLFKWARGKCLDKNRQALANAARHSQAENLWIVVEETADGVSIRAHDDGRGSGAERDGVGLRGMRARVEGAGGELRIDRGAGRGFDVVAVLPLRSAAR